MSTSDADVRLVGHGAELARLDALLQQAVSAGPVVVIVEGPAGIGKTTLLRRLLRRHPGLPVVAASGLAWERHRAGALARRLADASVAWTSENARPGPGAPEPEDSASHVIAAAETNQGADGPATPAGRACDPGASDPGASGPGAAGSGARRCAAPDPGDLGEALAACWRERAEATAAASGRAGPLTVIVDDLDDADPVSAQALASAVARLGEARVLLLLTRTTEPVPGPVPGSPPAVGVLERIPTTVLAVPALDPDQVRLLAARAGVELPLPVARRLCVHTGGNPRHLLELLRDTPAERWSDWKVRLPAPNSVLGRVRAALQRCSAGARALVEAAAVLGESSVLAEAAALAGLEDPVATLDEAHAAGLLGVAPGHGLDSLTFPGRFVRAAVYATLGPARRHDLHLSAARLLPDETDRLRHRVEAAPLPDDDLAAELLALARRKADEGAWAVVAGALTDASRISRSRADREQRLILAVDALAGAGLLGQAVDALPEIEALPPSAYRDAVLAYVAVQRGRRAEAAVHLDTAWELRGQDRHAAAIVCQRHVLHALADWDGEALVRWAGRAVEYAEPGSPAAVESRAVAGLGHAARGEIDKAFAVYRAAVADSPAGPQLQRARMGLGWLHLAQDAPEAARRELEFAVPTVRQAGSNRISLWALGWLARTRFALGDWPGALRAVDQAEVLLAATGLDLIRPLVHWTAVQIHALRAEQDDVERHLRLLAAGEHDYHDYHDYTVMAVPVLLARAQAAEAASDYPAVVRHLSPLVTRTGLDEPGFWPWHELYADALVLTDELAAADGFLTPLERLAERRGHRSTAARLGRVRGRLLAARGDLAAAERAFAEARARLAGLPLRYEQARVDFTHGVTLRRAGRRRDAAALIGTARQEFAALGAAVYVHRCDRELKTGRPAVPGTADVAEGLTEQERTVAGLVATGRTNKEVAAEMMLSVKTVQFHLTRIYGKLGVRSRAELATRLAPGAQGSPGR